MESESPYKIAHLSDLHLTPDDNDPRSGVNIFGRLKGMNENFRLLLKQNNIQKADSIIITGDITDRGDFKSWKVFWDAVGAAKLKRKVITIPGNHDLCCLGLRGGFRKNNIRKDIRKAVNGLEYCNQPTDFPWAKKIEDRIVLIGVDSNNAGNYHIIDNAYGRIGYAQFLKLGELLRKYRDTPIKIVCLHHSPNLCRPETAKKRGRVKYKTLDYLTTQMDQKDRQFLRVLCASHRVRLILHGHLHQADEQKVGGVRIIGAPSSTQPISTRSSIKKVQYYEYSIRGIRNYVYSSLKTEVLPGS